MHVANILGELTWSKNIFQTSGDFATITQVAGLTLKTREAAIICHYRITQ